MKKNLKNDYHTNDLLGIRRFKPMFKLSGLRMPLFFTKFLFLVCTFFNFSCIGNEENKTIISRSVSIGEINNDSTFNGPINFYDTLTNSIIETATYKNGMLHGERFQFNKDGKVIRRISYKEDKQHGFLLEYDSIGEIKFKQNFYYGLRVGPNIYFQDNQVKKYEFYSLENIKLVSIDYDSVYNKPLHNINNNSFFFFHINPLLNAFDNKSQNELFVYLPKPPKFNFNYSLCAINNSYHITKEIQAIEQPLWEMILLDSSKLGKDESFALKLEIDNEFDNDSIGTAVLIKKIK